jgi:ferrous iron transport protein A
MLNAKVDPEAHTNPQIILTLSDLPAGRSASVVSLAGGRGIISRMASLGFTPGVEITVLQNRGHGPLIALVRGTRVALGRQEARKIIIQKCEE